MKKSLGVNTIAYPAPVWVVGTYSEDGSANGATIAWGGICNSKPPSLAISLRAATHSHGNVVRRRAFTVSIPSQTHASEADFFGMASGAKGNKFVATGLTPTRSELVDAPYVEEFSLVIECELLQTFELGLHTQFIGGIVDVKADTSVLDDDGCIDVMKLAPLCFAPASRTYHAMGPVVGKAFDIGKAFSLDKTKLDDQI